jgi:hypothetical protein
VPELETLGNGPGLPITGPLGAAGSAEHREQDSNRTGIGPIVADDTFFDGRWLVGGARFELWTRPLTFEFVLTY